ncbi:MAG: bifunctional non-ous end joining protein LigD [Acidimicrobiaceae bacterium]|nr:bifunctional non-ous end joining protein LigD [Acidimicrobiaceae bacterium]MDQ1399472.1 bifunctional non-ous end joining protein LigD [Acidimicrobiaceae bacterium]MDQ1415375.1 bifunctional non-ous end joining protein LigD [Acidimicrobiaceae bacterium]
MTPSTSVEVDMGGRQLKLSNLDKVLWPATGFTKGQMIDYYARISPVMLGHVEGRPITLRRYPNGVDKTSFFEKNCPSHRPPWLPTIDMGGIGYCCLGEPAALVWTANLAAIEIHPSLARSEDLACPRSVVFDLDPGEGADVLTCGRVAFLLQEALDVLKLQAWVKTSGSKGLQVYVPLNTPVTYDDTRPFSHALAQVLERQHPGLIVTTQDKSVRPKKVLIDWSQNTASKTTVSVYSMRARDRPTVSTPLEWSEVEAAMEAGDPEMLVFEAPAVLQRVAEKGDLMAPLLSTEQVLPGGISSR